MARFEFCKAWPKLLLATLVSPLFLTSIGCGSKTDAVADASTTGGSVASVTTVDGESVPGPTDVVSQFLDLVRRGGADSGAGSLLTQQAQSELRRIGRNVQPIGSPNAKFTVTRAEMIPDEPGSALVHSIWGEPTTDGSKVEYQVVWALQRESVGWRISGLAMEIDPNQNPLIIDFENGQRLAQLLDDTAPPAANDTIAR
ncbi:hypothetical protein Poly51_28640 [Rubripirellula tenax]|uniref:DUF3828 domain-containing protein n=1 Tax=Rubripirellula tenax TaxID=2528015 RepID=A0A5C6F6R3_9BACT|nr:hypothetical protein [Rubripirellula tenax]TWU56945.1 hypothetical protein Poly51_28640 [Rubripirellula tenax]